MSRPYEATGRTQQKSRTRAAMVEATRALLREGTTPTVEQAAQHAGVSRTTAYRYFPNRRALLRATNPDLERPSLLDDDDAPDGAEERLDLVTATIGRQVLDFEAELRATLRLALEGGDAPTPLRTGRALTWIEDALAPLRPDLGARRVRRLALAVRATCGIDAFVWLTDVGGLGREDAVELMRESARALLRDARRPAA